MYKEIYAGIAQYFNTFNYSRYITSFLYIRGYEKKKNEHIILFSIL